MNNLGWFGLMVYCGSIFIAMSFKIMPLWPSLQAWNPDWVLLIVMYWVLATPYKYGILNAWIVGLLTDVLTGRPLGQYALVYALISYLCLKFYKRVRHFPILQQGGFVFCCLFLAQMLLFFIETIHRPAHFQGVFILPVVSGTLIWPVAGLLLRHTHFSRHVR